MTPTGVFMQDLQRRHAEPQRHYHTWEHVEALKRHYDDMSDLWHRPVPVLWALYWHDAIYDPHRSDNEEKSAQLLEKDARGYLAGDDLAFAAQIIRATASHEVPAGLAGEDREDLARFLDIDLSMLGAPPALFDTYQAQIRAEYDFVPDQAFRQVREEILTGFLERPQLYLTKEARERWEAQARNNLQRAVAELQA